MQCWVCVQAVRTRHACYRYMAQTNPERKAGKNEGIYIYGVVKAGSIGTYSIEVNKGKGKEMVYMARTVQKVCMGSVHIAALG